MLLTALAEPNSTAPARLRAAATLRLSCFSRARDHDALAAKLRRQRFDADFGWQIGAHLRELAKARALPITIDVLTFAQVIF